MFDLQGLIRWAPLVTTALDLVWPLLRQVARVCAWRVDMLAQPMVKKSHAAQVCRSEVHLLLFSKSNKVFFGYFDPKVIFLDNENK